MLELNQQNADVLLISSQVVYGSIGLNAAVPVLHNAGVRAVTLPTVVLSSMPRYTHSHRVILDPEWLQHSLDDLLALGIIDQISTIATGYFASAAQVEVVARWLQQNQKPHLKLIVDPVVGDSDVGIYAAPGVAEAIAEHLIPLATGLTPNAFEFDHFTSGAIDTVAAGRALLGSSGEWIVVTSFASDSDQISDLIITQSDSTEIYTQRVPTQVKGAGDVFAAALLTALHNNKLLIDAVTYAAAFVNDALVSKGFPK